MCFCVLCLCTFFFFKQKTAYELRISDRSSDVCSSDLFGVGATFVSSTNTDDEVVYQVVKAVFENFDRFRRLHPAFANLKKEDMITKNISAPLHAGAVRYYKEAGLM